MNRILWLFERAEQAALDNDIPLARELLEWGGELLDQRSASMTEARNEALDVIDFHADHPTTEDPDDLLGWGWETPQLPQGRMK